MYIFQRGIFASIQQSTQLTAKLWKISTEIEEGRMPPCPPPLLLRPGNLQVLTPRVGWSLTSTFATNQPGDWGALLIVSFFGENLRIKLYNTREALPGLSYLL